MTCFTEFAAGFITVKQGCRFVLYIFGNKATDGTYGSKNWFPGFGFDSGQNLQPYKTTYRGERTQCFPNFSQEKVSSNLEKKCLSKADAGVTYDVWAGFVCVRLKKKTKRNDESFVGARMSQEVSKWLVNGL